MASSSLVAGRDMSFNNFWGFSFRLSRIFSKNLSIPMYKNIKFIAAELKPLESKALLAKQLFDDSEPQSESQESQPQS